MGSETGTARTGHTGPPFHGRGPVDVDVAVRSAPLPALVVDAGGRLLAHNEGAATLLDLPLQDGDGAAPRDRGMHVGALLPERSASALLRRVREAIDTTHPEQQLGSLFLGLHPGSGPRRVRVLLVALSGQGPVLVLFDASAQGTHTDRELRYKNALLESQNDSALDGILIVDPESRVVSMNRRFIEMWDLPEDVLEVGGRDDHALAQALDKLEDPEEFLRRIEWLHEHPEARTRERIRFRDGRVLDRWSTPVRGEDGTFYGRGWYFRDVTKQVESEQALQDAYRELKEAEAFRTRLVQTISHDLGTAMTPIRIHLHMLAKAIAGREGPAGPGLEVLRRNIAQLERLVQDLKDVAKLEDGRLQVHPRPLDLSAALRTAHASFEASCREKGVDLEVEVEPGLHVQADGDRVLQVLFNLLSNARRFTPEGGHIRLISRRGPDHAEVIVADTGRGLTDEEAARLFRPFSQVHDADEVEERGTGLGLYITRGLVEQHGGQVWVESEGHGKGSAFHLTLPYDGPPRSEGSRDEGAAVDDEAVSVDEG